MALIVPAVLPATKRELAEHLTLLSSLSGVHRIQIDVVDGRLASPASWPYNDPVGGPTSHIDEVALPDPHRIEYEVDLMCLDALAAAGHWLALGASRLTFHIESAVAEPSLFERVKKRYGEFVTLGLALNLSTDPSLAEPLLPHLNYVQFMGIETIGRQGQPFDSRALARVRDFHARHPHVPVQVDGGVTRASARALRAAGAGDLIVGSAILAAPDPRAAFAAFEAL